MPACARFCPALTEYRDFAYFDDAAAISPSLSETEEHSSLLQQPQEFALLPARRKGILNAVPLGQHRKPQEALYLMRQIFRVCRIRRGKILRPEFQP